MSIIEINQNRATQEKIFPQADTIKIKLGKFEEQ